MLTTRPPLRTFIVLRIEDGTPKAELATEWRWDDSRTVLSLTLRDDVAFHSGRPMTADDVVFTMEKVKDPANGSQLAGVAAGITSVEAVDDTHVEITLAAPNDSMFDLLDLTPIVDKDTFAGLADGSEVVGTGPFLWKSWQPGASIVLSRNDEYRVPDRPYLDEVDISIVTDPAALSSAVRGGSADIGIGMTQSVVTALKSDDNYAVEDAGGVFYPFGVDVTQAPFDKPEARQAVVSDWSKDSSPTTMPFTIVRSPGAVRRSWQ